MSSSVGATAMLNLFEQINVKLSLSIVQRCPLLHEYALDGHSLVRKQCVKDLVDLVGSRSSQQQ